MLPLQDTRNSNVFPFWVVVLIAINVYFFYLEITSPNPDLFILQYALIPAQVDFTNLNSLTPFITSQFLHGNLLHILSNMWFLWVFGDNVEARLGNLLFPIFYLGVGIIAGLAQYLIIPTSPIPALGASGAIAGVLGAYFAFFPHNKIRTLIFLLFFVTIVEIPASVLLFYWFVIQLISGAATVQTADIGGIAYFAHVGGFVSGWLISKLIQL